MSWWVTRELSHGVIYLGSWIFWVLFSITLHELGHGWAAIRQGDDVPLYTGHMTWNPIVHMGQWSLLMFALTGLAWGAMPTNPHNYKSRYGEAIVAVAGPAMNLLLGLVASLSAALWLAYAHGVAEPVRTNVLVFLHIGAGLNVILLLLNLIPIPPLDGWRIVADIYPKYNRLWQTEHGGLIALGVFTLLYMRAGGFLSGMAFGGVSELVQTVASLLRR
jgi:Zn-dependent protease